MGGSVPCKIVLFIYYISMTLPPCHPQCDSSDLQRRGVVEGVDFGATGEVKKVDITRMRERLDGGCIVLLSNLGHSSSGEVLNCKYA